MAEQRSGQTSDIGFLHTAEIHVATFAKLAAARGLTVEHSVQPEWLAAAIRGGLSSSLTELVQTELQALADRSRLVICTCSTLGELASRLNQPTIFRVDQPMMDQAAASPAPALLAYCLDSTKATSLELLQAAFKRAGQEGDVLPVNCAAAWSLFELGHNEEFGKAIAEQINSLTEQSPAGCVVLAQASMAAALPWIHAQTVLCSPTTAMDYAEQLLQQGTA